MKYNQNMALPRQMLSFRAKTKEWGKENIDAVCNMGGSITRNGRSSEEHKQANYDLINSIINEDDFKYILDPYGQGDDVIGTQPAKLRDINLIANKFNKLCGEELSRPFNPIIMGVNGNVSSEKSKKKKEAMMFLCQSMLASELGVDPAELVKPETGEQKSFEDIERYFNKSYKDIREQWGQHIWEYVSRKENSDSKFNKGFGHALAVAEECYRIDVVNNEVKIRLVNPIGFEYDRNLDDDRIENGDWMCEERYMTRGQIMDEFGELLSESDKRKIDKGDFRPSIGEGMLPGFLYGYDTVHKQGDRDNDNTHVKVTYTCWKSMKKLGFVSYPDETGKMQESIVDETFKLSEEQIAFGYTIEWKWVPEWWEGVKIGEDIHTSIQPIPNQIRSIDNPYYVPSPYVGRVYNSLNSIQTSLVDLIKPHQHLYNVVWHKLEMELAKAKGKKFLMDFAQIPKSQGINMDEWMYYFDNLGIAFINSFEEGTGSFQGQKASANFNQFTSVDMSLSQAVGQYISILNKIENTIDRMVGINAQREGDIQQRETTGGIDQAITMSSHITECFFYTHNQIKRDVVSRVIETAKYAYEGSKKLDYIVGDVERISTTVDMDKYLDSDYGVFVSDSTRDHNIFLKLESMMSQMVASGAASFSDAIKMFKSTSISGLSGEIEASEMRRDQKEQQQMEHEKELNQQNIQAQASEKEAERQFEAEQEHLNRQNKLQIASINNLGFDEDIQNNDQLDAVKQSEIYQKQMDSERKHATDNRKIDSERSIKERELELKNKEIDSKERIEKLKAKTQLKNPVPGEKKSK